MSTVNCEESDDNVTFDAFSLMKPIDGKCEGFLGQTVVGISTSDLTFLIVS